MSSQIDVQAVNMSPKLGIGAKVSYGLGDFASNMSWALVSGYILIFFTDVAKLNPIAISTLLLVARVWDGINDPLMGLIMDKTKSKFGRFRPYLLYAPIFMALFNVLTFTVPNFGPIGNLIFAYVSYIGLDMAYTAVNIPYGALAGVMTQDPNERTKLASFRMIFAFIAIISINMMIMPIIQGLGAGNQSRGYFFTALILSIVAIPFFWTTFFFTKEVVTPPKEQKISFRDSLRCVYTNRPLLSLMAASLFSATGTFGRAGVAIYYYIYVLGRPDLVPLFSMVGLTAMVGIVLAPVVSAKIGKRNTSVTAGLLGLIGLVGLYTTPFNSISMVFFWMIFQGIFSGFGAAMTWSLIADCVEYAEWKTGIRADGFVYSSAGLIAKIGMAVGGSGAVLILKAIGYVPNAVQSPSTMQGINAMVNLLPAILSFIGTIPMIFYNINNKNYQQMVKEISEKRAAA